MIVVVSDEVSFVVSQQLLQTVCAGPWEAGVQRAEGGHPLCAHVDSTACGLLRGMATWFHPVNATLSPR